MVNWDLFHLMQGWFNICKSINVIHHSNKMKSKIYTIITIDTKMFDKTPHPLMTETLERGSPARVTVNESFYSRIRSKTRIPPCHFLWHRFGSPSTATRQEEKSNHPNLKDRSKTVIICRWHGNIYRKTPKLWKKLLELIDKYTVVSGGKGNTQNLLHLIH